MKEKKDKGLHIKMAGIPSYKERGFKEAALYEAAFMATRYANRKAYKEIEVN